MGLGRLPGWLSDCVSKDASQCELFIVRSGEVGDMAGSVRDRVTQAVLFVDESIVDIGNAELDELLDDELVKAIIAALSVGICYEGFWAAMFEIERLRYHKIILVMDQSPEGRHNRTQLIQLFHVFFGPLLEGGFVYESPVDPLSLTSEEEFEAKVMSPSRVELRRLKLGADMSETLELNRS